MRCLLNLILAVGLTAACQREATLTYNQPPAGSYTIGTRQVRIGDSIVPIDGASVTTEFFKAVGVLPRLGRFFIESDHAPQATPVAVLSHDLWRGRFESSAAIVGRTIDVDGRLVTVVGIAPQGFTLPGSTMIWTPK
jgi:hypothetical protein